MVLFLSVFKTDVFKRYEAYFLIKSCSVHGTCLA